LAPPTGYVDGAGRGVIADPSGEILVGGYVESFTPSDNRDPAIAAVTPAGALDTAAFAGGTGYVLLPLAGSFDQANGLARQPDGKLVIGGTAGDVGSFDFLAARFSASGVLDTGFASPAGYTTTDFSGATSSAARWRSRAQGSPMSAEMLVSATSGLRRSMHSPLRPRGVEAAERSLQPRRLLPPRRSARRRRSTGPPPRRSARSGSSPKP
jgi:hypothetical protein